MIAVVVVVRGVVVRGVVEVVIVEVVVVIVVILMMIKKFFLTTGDWSGIENRNNEQIDEHNVEGTYLRRYFLKYMYRIKIVTKISLNNIYLAYYTTTCVEDVVFFVIMYELSVSRRQIMEF